MRTVHAWGFGASIRAYVGEDGTEANSTRGVALDHVSPARLFFALLKRRFTGAVGLDQAGTRRHVWLRGGMPLYTDWDSATDVLGEVLIGRGLVSPDVCERGLATKARDGGYLGRILVRQGAIDEAALTAALSEQCARKVGRIFSLRCGDAWVDPAAPDVDELADMKQPINVLHLVRNGVAAHYDVARIEAEMGPALAGSVVVTDAFARYREHFGFSQRERVLLPDVERGTTITDLIELAASRESALTVVYCLWACQMLRVGAGDSLANVRPNGLPGGASQHPAVAATASRPGASSDSRGSGVRVRPVAGPDPAAGSSASSLPTVGSGARRVPNRRAPTRDEPSASGRLPRSDDPFESQLAAFENKVRANAHAFALLGLSVDAGRKEVRSVWAVLSRRFHPDAVEAEGRGHLRDRVQRVFAALSEANSLLSKEEEREKLKLALEIDPDGGAQLNPNAVVRNALEAELLARDADKFLKARNFPRALDLYEKSLELSPREAEVAASAAWCRFQLTQRTRSDALMAIKSLEMAVTEQPRCARAHYYLGMARLQVGFEKLALASFEAAHESDSKLIDAERQARAIRLNSKSRGKANSKKGFGLRGLFGRKSD